jgi:ribosomal-protein-alanine N-acetyltransferase
MAMVREAVAGDLEAVAAIVAASPLAPQWGAAEFDALMKQGLSGPLQRRLLVAEDEGVVAGFAVYTLLAAVFPPDAELESLAVAPGHRRRGLGAALLLAVGEATAAAGAESLVLEVRAGNAAALELYRGVGFHAAGIRRGYYASPTEDAVLMRLPFAEQTS